MSNKKKLVLVDGSYYLFRAFHALSRSDLRTSDGRPSGAIFGVMNMLRKLLNDQQPDYFAVVFDPKGPSFRSEMYPDYKAHRPPMPDDLRSQIEPLQEIIRSLGLPLLIIDGVEADDVIATLAKKAEDKGIEAIISSGDKDLAQIVNDGIRMVNTMNGGTLDPEGVKKKFGVGPEQIIDYLALVGDSVDNVPGVTGVGPKTAAKWLNQYGSLDAVVKHADDIKGKVGENLRNGLEQLRVSRELVMLKLDVQLEQEPEQLVRTRPDADALDTLLKDWEIRGWDPDESAAREATKQENNNRPAGDAVYELVLAKENLDTWLQRLREAGLFCLDTETTSLDYITAEIVGVSFAVEPGHAAYVPLAHDYPGAPQQLPRKQVLESLRPLLESDQYHKLGHNLKYDMSVLANHDIKLAGIRHDSMLESYVLDSTASRHDMDTLAEKHLGAHTTHYEDVAGKGAKQIPFNQVHLDQAGPYAAEDADITLRLHRTFWPRLSLEPGLKSIYEDLEIPLVGVLSRMERNGVRVNADLLRVQSRELSTRMAELEQQAFDAAGQPFNIGSPKQIQAILYDKLGLEPPQRTPKGQPSTAESALQALAEDHELPRLILEHRALSKLKSTYTDRLPQQINERTGRVHTSYHQAVAATGRLSSSDPNLQNIPVRTAEGRRIRQAFVAEPGNILLAADYSQIELRIMAHLSGDPALQDAFSRGQDIHRMTAAEVFGAAPGTVSNEQRRAAKAINFGLIYGMSPYGLARQLGIERSAAKEYVDLYFQRYPGVKDYMDRVRAQARDRGYVETVFGRRLYLPEINARNAARRQYAERTAINAPMQGTAADIIKRAMIGVDRALCERFSGVRMIMQVHDELVFELPRSDLEQVSSEIVSLMVGAAQLRVPLAVDTGSGENWDQAH